jgi:hypothetical protein
MPEPTVVNRVPRNGTVYIPGHDLDNPVLLATNASDIKVAGANSKDTTFQIDNNGKVAAGVASRPATYHTLEFFHEGEKHLIHTNMPFFVSYNGKG